MNTGLVKLDELLPGQREILPVVRNPEIDTIAWIGSIRSGKGVGCANAIIDLIIRNRVEKGYEKLNYIFGAQTGGSFQRNNEAYLFDICDQAGLSAKFVGGTRPRYEIGGIATAYLFGGDTQRSYLPVRGITAHSAWIDEATLCNQMFVQTVAERCSFDDSKVILSSNADRPTHWLKTDYIDAEIEGFYLIESDFNENRHYSEIRRNRLKRLNPDTANYQRAIMNVWAGEEGLIIPIRPEHIIEDKLSLTGYIVVDPGTAGVTAATLWTQTDYGWAIVDEYYHTGSKQGRISDKTHIERMRSKGWTILGATVDPAGQSMKAAISEMGWYADNAKNSFDTGIQTVNNALYSGNLKIHKRCENLFKEASGYIWRETSETPDPKSADHLMDTVRYGAMKYCPNSRTEVLL